MFNKQAVLTVALVGVSSLVSAALAAEVSYQILIPCGASGASHHAIVPDASGCQKISESGAFSVASTGTFEHGVRIGFSADADCKRTYTPSLADLAKMQASQSCTILVAQDSDGADPKKEGVKVVQEGHGPGKKRDVELGELHPDAYAAKQGDPDTVKPGKKKRSTSEEHDPRAYGGGPDPDRGFIRKRDSGGGQKGGQPGETETNTMPETLPPGQTALKYVMLVTAK